MQADYTGRAMAQATAIRLTGDDLRIEDVWSVALEGAGAVLSEDARSKMRAARELGIPYGQGYFLAQPTRLDSLRPSGAAGQAG